MGRTAHKAVVIVGILALSMVLGATVFRDQVAWAAQSMDVRITNVDANGNVKMHEQGTASVAVDGVVSTRPHIPAAQFSWGNSHGDKLVSGPDPAGTRYAISSISATLGSFTTDGGQTALIAVAAPDNTCQTEGPLVGPVTFGPFIAYVPGTTSSMTFPQPYVIDPPTSGDPVCLIIRAINNGADMAIVGYRF